MLRAHLEISDSRELKAAHRVRSYTSETKCLKQEQKY